MRVKGRFFPSQGLFRLWIGMSGVLLACTVLGPPASAENRELADTELRAVLERIEASEAFQRAAARERDPRLYRVGSWAYESEPEGGRQRTLAEVLYFKYEGGITIRVQIDLDSLAVQQVEALEAYPTPLSPEEEAQAVSLARENSEAVRSLLARSGEDEVDVEMLNPVISNRDDPRYGHRIVYVTFRRNTGNPESAMVEVDLTAKNARPQGANR